jgi:hypothetical protein
MEEWKKYSIDDAAQFLAGKLGGVSEEQLDIIREELRAAYLQGQHDPCLK